MPVARGSDGHLEDIAWATLLERGTSPDDDTAQAAVSIVMGLGWRDLRMGHQRLRRDAPRRPGPLAPGHPASLPVRGRGDHASYPAAGERLMRRCPWFLGHICGMRTPAAAERLHLGVRLKENLAEVLTGLADFNDERLGELRSGSSCTRSSRCRETRVSRAPARTASVS